MTSTSATVNLTTAGATVTQQNNDLIPILTSVVVGIAMLGIGCSVDFKMLLEHLKKPKAYLLGVIMQLVFVPPFAWAFTKIFQMPIEEAIGVMIQGSTPGGTVSNIVVYWFGGIVGLSVAMTTTTTLLAMGTMPLWLFLFQKGENVRNDLIIPFQDLGIILASLIIPLIFGMLFYWKFTKYALKISTSLIVLGTVGLVAVSIANAVITRIQLVISWQQGVIAATLPLVIYILAYLTASLKWFGLDRKKIRTVSLETVLQNTQVAVAVINFSFSPSQLEGSIIFPALYFGFSMGYLFLGAFLIWLLVKKGLIEPDKEEANNNVEEMDNGEINMAYQNEEVLFKNEVSCITNGDLT